MRQIDDRILEALSQDDQEALDDYARELGIFELISASFKTRMKWMVIAIFTLVLVFFGLAIWCGYHFFTTDELVTKLNWFGGLMMSFLAFALLRLAYFTELQRISLAREVKRLELQVALLARQLKQAP